MNKPWYQSMTIVGGSIYAALQFLESAGAMPAGVSGAASTLVQAIAGLVTLIGLRRAVGGTPTP